MQQLNNIFKVRLDIQGEYNSLQLAAAEVIKRDEEWFDEVDHSICAFKQKIHCWIRNAELVRKASPHQNLVEAVNLLEKREQS